jgi:hypothetical protein
MVASFSLMKCTHACRSELPGHLHHSHATHLAQLTCTPCKEGSGRKKFCCQDSAETKQTGPAKIQVGIPHHESNHPRAGPCSHCPSSALLISQVAHGPTQRSARCWAPFSDTAVVDVCRKTRRPCGSSVFRNPGPRLRGLPPCSIGVSRPYSRPRALRVSANKFADHRARRPGPGARCGARTTAPSLPVRASAGGGPFRCPAAQSRWTYGARPQSPSAWVCNKAALRLQQGGIGSATRRHRVCNSTKRVVGPACRRAVHEWRQERRPGRAGRRAFCPSGGKKGRGEEWRNGSGARLQTVACPVLLTTTHNTTKYFFDNRT